MGNPECLLTYLQPYPRNAGGQIGFQARNKKKKGCWGQATLLARYYRLFGVWGTAGSAVTTAPIPVRSNSILNKVSRSTEAPVALVPRQCLLQLLE
jgi:hypothetical protein